MMAATDNTPGNNHEFDSHRTPCPECGSRRGFARLKGTDGGKCHACQAFIPPTAEGRAPMPTTLAPRNGSRCSRPPSRIVATYDYADEQGVVLYIVERLEPKGFRQARIADDGSRVYTMDGVRRVLYNLPSVIEAVRRGWPVIIVEGEKDAETYNAIFAVAGFQAVATTSAQGASGWNAYARGYIESLRGARIIVDGDCDEPGAQFMRQVGASLKGVATEIQITTEARQAIAGEFSGPKDITERIETGMTPEQAVERLRQSQPIRSDVGNVDPSIFPEKPKDAKDANIAIGGMVGILGILGTVETAPAYHTWVDLRKEIGDITWSWTGFIPKGMPTMLAGDSGTGKSYLALQIAASFILGQRFPDGTECTERGKVLWIDCEGAMPMNLQRAKILGLPDASFITPDTGGDTPSLDNPRHRELIMQLAMMPDVVFIVLDSLSAANTRDEKNGEMMTVAHVLKDLAANSGKALLVIHHTRKPQGNYRARLTIHDVRGHGSIVQLARVVLGLDAPNTNDPTHKRLLMLKNNLALHPNEDIGFRITDDGISFGQAPEQVPPTDYEGSSKLSDAESFLQRILADGESLKQPEILELGKEEGISERTIHRAKKSLRVISEKRGQVWYWKLPDGVPDDDDGN